jgi:threonine dehydrogenase-like Zn-dependent dehydrogenase
VWLAGAIAELADTERRGADVVILTVVTRATMQVAMESVRWWYNTPVCTKPNQEFPADWWSIWRREINLISSYSSTPEPLTGDGITQTGGLSIETLVSHVFATERSSQRI